MLLESCFRRAPCSDAAFRYAVTLHWSLHCRHIQLQKGTAVLCVNVSVNVSFMYHVCKDLECQCNTEELLPVSVVRRNC